MSASGHDEDNRVDAVCDDIRRVASAPSEPPGAGAVLPGRVAHAMRALNIDRDNQLLSQI